MLRRRLGKTLAVQWPRIMFALALFSICSSIRFKKHTRNKDGLFQTGKDVKCLCAQHFRLCP